jgi:hypothetical protein
MCINNTFFVYTNKNKCYTKTEKLTKWFDLLKLYVAYRIFDPLHPDTYSQHEIDKLQYYNNIINTILKDISFNIDHTKNTIIGIEGYSYSTATRAIIDLVAFGTMLRMKLLEQEIYNIFIVSPSTLKMQACKLTYGCNINSKGKEIPCINKNNISGGRFTKHEMMKSLLENNNLQDDWYVKLLNDKFTELLSANIIPNPIEDLNDAKLLYEIILDICKNTNYDMIQFEKILFKK